MTFQLISHIFVKGTYQVSIALQTMLQNHFYQIVLHKPKIVLLPIPV